MTLPIFRSLVPYRRGWLRGDVIAGVTVWAVLVPEALAYASIAGVSPVVGLYAAPAALVLYAMFGSSRHLVVGPMSATAALSAAAVGEFAKGGTDRFTQLTIELALITGLVALLAGLLRLGFLANYISEPVLKGFIVGLALTIIIGQVPKLFGVAKTGGDFFQQVWGVIRHLPDASGVTLVVGLVSLALVVGLRRVAPVVPGSLAAVAFGVAATKLLNLDQHGVEIVGHITPGLPSLGLPNTRSGDALGLTASAVGVMLVGFSEGLGAAKTYAAREHYEIDANRELVGLGAANLGAGLSSGMVVNGSLSKTAVNGSAGAKTQLSGIFVAALTIVTLLFLTGLFEDLPEATLAAVVIAAVVELVDIPALVHLYHVFTGKRGHALGVAIRPDFIAALAAMLGVLILDTLPGLFLGIGVSLLLLIYRASQPHIAELGHVPGTRRQYADIARNADNQPVPGILILRPESGLFFANADHIRTTILRLVAEHEVHGLVLDAETVPFIDVSAVSMLTQLFDELDRRGVRLVLARDIGQVRDIIERDDETQSIPVYPTVQAAVEALGSRR